MECSSIPAYLSNYKPSDFITAEAHDPEKIMELTSKMLVVREPDAIIKPVPYSDIENVDIETLRIIMGAWGLYTFPTKELIEWLEEQIDEYTEGYEPAIEICAGTGWIGRELGIPMTDSKIQAKDGDYRTTMLLTGNNPITYPSDIEELDAIKAIKKYKPEYVIASYATHKSGSGGSSIHSGFIYGVDSSWVIRNCHKYFLIGSTKVHKGDPIMKRPHKELSFPWLVTRSGREFSRIFVWENKQW